MHFNPLKSYIVSVKCTGNRSVHFYTPCDEVLQSVSKNPYLGVLFSKDLSFPDHIRKVSAKSSRSGGFLIRNLKQMPSQAERNSSLPHV